MPISLQDMEGLNTALYYNPASGKLYWTGVNRHGVKCVPGKEAGHLNKRGYLEIRYLGKTLQAHRIAWYLHTGSDPGAMSIDHVNGNRADNRMINLRTATARQNSQNQKKRSRLTTSEYKGVSWYARHSKWMAQIRIGGKSTHLGYFHTEEEAFLAYCQAADKHFGEFARYE
jgi:hypothetical protein